MIYLQRTHLLLVTALLAAAALVVGCAESTAAALPDYVMQADHNVQESYQHAVDHPDHFETVPCYCGCHRIGHSSELDCFIADKAEDGTITFDNHASVCGICVDIAQDVIRLREEGKSAIEVRQAIDAEYAEIGAGTDTAYPTE